MSAPLEPRAAGLMTGPTCKATGLVIERREWSEASQILTLFTAEYGRCKALAKGARRPKSRHGGGCDLLDRVTVVLYPRERGLHLLAETAHTAEQPARALRGRLAPLLAGLTVAETLREGTHEHEPAPALYHDAIATLIALGGARRPGTVLAAFEWRFLATIGFELQLDGCAACGVPLPAGPVPFAPAAGGACCRDCQPEAPGPVRTLPAPARACLAELRDGGAADDVAPRTLRDARAALAAVLRALGDRPRRTDRFARLIETTGAPTSPRAEVA